MRTQSICLALVIVLIFPFASAQWVQTNGPYGGDVTCMVASGPNLFVAANHSIFRSNNNGKSWTAARSGLPPISEISSLAVRGANLIAGLDCDGIWVSTDNGASWSPTGLTDVANQATTGCSCSRFSPLLVSDSVLFVGTCGGVWRTNGKYWNYLSLPTGSWVVQALTASGTNIFAGIWSLQPYSLGNLYRSSINGGTWTAVNRGWADSFEMVLATSGTNLFAATEGGVFRSTDDGASWTTLNTGLTDSSVSALTVWDGYLFAGTRGGRVFCSTNNGTNWTAADSGMTSERVTCFAASGTNLFAGTNGLGVFVSTNKGTSWTQESAGLHYSDGVALAVCGANLLARHHYNCMSLSIDSGASWTPLNTGMVVMCTASMGATVVAGTNDGVYISANNGVSWGQAGGVVPKLVEGSL